MQPEGASELAIDEELLAAAMVGVVERGEHALIGSGGVNEGENRRTEREVEASADVDGLGG